MELPDDVLRIIKEYSMPITRLDWRKGCYFNRYPYRIHDVEYTLKYMIRLIYRMYRYNITNLYDNMIFTELLMNTVIIN